MSSVDVVELMQKIPQKVRDIEGIKEEYRRKKDQLHAKYQAELAGIEEKIGKIMQERTKDLVKVQEDEKNAIQILAEAKKGVKKAQVKLKEAKEYLARTKFKARETIQNAQNTLKKQVDSEIDAIQKEIQFTQKQIREREKTLKNML